MDAIAAQFKKDNIGSSSSERNLDLMLGAVKNGGNCNKERFWGEKWSMGMCSHLKLIRNRQFFTDDNQGLWVMISGDIFDVEDTCVEDLDLNNDAQVLAHLYGKYGIRFIEKVDGAFSVSLYDEKKKTLLLARDRLGTKPLYYCENPTSIFAASEINSIIGPGFAQRTVDMVSVNLFFTYGFLPNPATLLKGIKQVKPGHILICSPEGIREKLYWKFEYNRTGPVLQDHEYLEKFRDIFKSAVSKRISKYPEAGAFLSGGLDTGSVVAMMNRLAHNRFKVFTAGFHEEKYNEIDEAKLLSDKFGLEHFTTVIGFDDKFPEFLENLVKIHEMPFSDTSAIPSYFVAKLAKEHVNTVFTGDFPDQLLGGSGHHRWALNRDENDPAWKRMLRNSSLFLNKFATSVSFSAGTTSFKDKLLRTLYRETFPLEEQRVILSMPIQPYLKGKLYSQQLIKLNKQMDTLSIAKNLYKEVRDENLLDKILYFDINFYAIDNLNVKVDRMCRANRLKAISPFWDRELVEFGALIPTHMKIRGTNQKYILRESMRSMLPEQTLSKKKQGFAMPIGQWLIHKMKGFVGDLLLDGTTLDRGYFDKKFMRTMVENFLAGKTDYATGSEATVISLITFELWHRNYIDSQK